MVKCPYCGLPATTLIRKSAMGPGRIVNCQSCGKPVTTHPIAVFAAIPAFLGGYAALHSGSLLGGMVAVAGGLLAMVFIQVFLVPLVRTNGS
jgi:hypothetical protein